MHISFNIVGVLIWLPFMILLAAIAVDLSPVAGGLEGTAKLAAMVRGLFETVRRRIELVVKAVGQSDQRAAQDVLLLRDKVRDFADRLLERHAQRLQIGDPKYVQRVRLLATFIEQLRNMYTLARRVTKTHFPPTLAQHEAWANGFCGSAGLPKAMATFLVPISAVDGDWWPVAVGAIRLRGGIDRPCSRGDEGNRLFFRSADPDTVRVATLCCSQKERCSLDWQT